MCPPFQQDCELAQCPSSHPVPPGTKVPSNQGHKTQWRFGSWTQVCYPAPFSCRASFCCPPPRRLNHFFSTPQCSASCGKGTRMRYVSCRDNQGGVAEEAACAHLPKPPAREVCSVVACGQWKVLEWTAVRKPPGAPSSSALSVKAALDYLEFYPSCPSLSKWCELSDRRKMQKRPFCPFSNGSATHYVERQRR